MKPYILPSELPSTIDGLEALRTTVIRSFQHIPTSYHSFTKLCEPIRVITIELQRLRGML